MRSSLVVVAHPRVGSFSHALAATAGGALSDLGHEVAHHDLYGERFDPVLSADGVSTVRTADRQALEAGADTLVATHRRELAAAHTLVVVHPNWWGKPPAIMAGWMDRVLAPGVVYELDDAAGEPRTLLGLRRLVVLNTGDTEPEREARVFGDPLDLIWRRCVGAYLDDVDVVRLLIGPVAGSSRPQREQWLEQAARSTGGAARPPTNPSPEPPPTELDRPSS